MSENISSNNIYQTQIPSLTDAADIQDAFKLYHFGSTTEPATASVSDGIAGHLYDLDTLKAPLAGPTFTGTLTAPTINASTALQIGGVAITSTAAELNILDGVTATAAELNILDGVTSTTAELNILDGVTSTAAELNILDGVTSTAAELNLVDGSSAGTIVTSKAVIYGASGEVNATTLQIGGTSITSSAAELNILDGVTSTSSELNLVDGSVAGTIVNNKAVIYGASGQVNATTLQIAGTSITSTAAELNVLDGITSTTAELNILDGVTSTASELNLVDGSVAGTIVNNKAVIYGAAGQVNATTLQIGGVSVTSTAAELNILDGVTSTAAELNILDGVTSTASELNLVDGSSAGTIVNSKALIYGSGGQVNATTLQIAGTNVLAAATPLPGAYGGTGVANTGKTITLGGNLTTSGAYATTLTTTGTTSLTLPTSGTVVSKDGSGNFSAGTITASLTGTATQATRAALYVTTGTDTGFDYRRIFVGPTAPENATHTLQIGDVWIDT